MERLTVQWNLRIKDTLGAELLSSFRRLSSGGRFKIAIYSHIKNVWSVYILFLVHIYAEIQDKKL